MVKSVSYVDVSTFELEAPRLQYIGGKSGTLKIDLFYDTYEQRTDVREHTDKISDLIKIDPKIHAPPPLKFIWGMEKEPFTCVAGSITKKFTMFIDKGIPVRARLTLDLIEFKMSLNTREETLQSPDKTKVHVTQLGDSLWMIAGKAYGNVYLWRPIADRNGIKNPRFLEPGTEIIIPPLE